MKGIHISDLNESEEYKRGFLAGFKFFMMKEIHRHLEDVKQGTEDISGLHDVKIPKELDFDCWIMP
jgi:hypothetical protein